MDSFIIINIFLLLFMFIGFLYITNIESKSLFISNIFSDIWLFFVTPTLGLVVNIIAYIVNQNNRYLLLGLVYLLFYIFRVISNYIKQKMDTLYYRKSIPIIKEKIDNYLDSLDDSMIDSYNIVLSRNADSNGIILKIKDNVIFNREEYTIYKKKIESMLSEYKVRVSYE